MAPDLSAIIARLRRAQPRNLDTMALCDALEAKIKWEALNGVKSEQWLKEQYNSALAFDRSAYQRDYMRDARAAKKLGISTAEYRRRDT